MNLSDIKHILQYEGETENFSQEVINLEPELKLEKDGQRAGLLSVIVVYFFAYRLVHFITKCIFFCSQF